MITNNTISQYASLSLFVVSSLSLIYFTKYHHHSITTNTDDNDNDVSYIKLIGNTPMIELKKLSMRLGCTFYVKMESMNPSGTGKDRAAKYMLMNMLSKHSSSSSGSSSGSSSSSSISKVVEGTSGSTGIALASLCNALKLQLFIVMPDDQANEKKKLLESLGATVTIVPCCAISNKDHYVNRAKKLAEEIGGVFVNQFENLSNYQAHLDETGPEIWNQTNGTLDAFVMSAGTGGTIAGVSRYLKSRNPNIKTFLADPPGSSLLNKVKYGVCYTYQQKESKLKKHRYDSIVEGVGLDRVTKNFDMGLIDDGVTCDDQEILDMAHFLLREEGLFVGSSSSLNVVASCKVVHELKKQNIKNPVIVTVICDTGQRHVSRFWNPDYVGNYNLVWPANDVVPTCLR
jgi:cysteine synthase A